MMASRAPSHRHRPLPYLILTNISKRQNVKSLLQVAAAYGCPTVFVVGQRAFEFDPDVGGTDVPPSIRDRVRAGGMRIVRFDGLEECVRHVRGLPLRGAGVDVSAGRRGPVVAEDANAITDGEGGTTMRPTVPIIGVEIHETSASLEDEPFGATSVAFMMGNEGSGMTAKQMSVCDSFLRIPQYGGGTASLNVSVAAGLVFHRFLHWSRGDAVRKYCDG